MNTLKQLIITAILLGSLESFAMNDDLAADALSEQNEADVSYRAPVFKIAEEALAGKRVINEIDDAGNNILMRVIAECDETNEHDVALVHSLLKNKANLNHENNDGKSPLEVAIFFSKLNTITMLIEWGANAIPKEKQKNWRRRAQWTYDQALKKRNAQ